MTLSGPQFFRSFVARRAIWLIAFVLITAQSVEARCRQALAFGLDVSGSVDASEYRLQMQGLANALNHPEVRTALLGPAALPVEIAVFEWSGPEYQRVLLNWTAITDAATLNSVTAQIASTPRQPAPPVTGLGQAMLFGQDLLRQRARPYLFSNSVAPPIVAASIAAINLLENSTELRDRLHENTSFFREGISKLGLEVLPGEHPIVPVMLGDARLATEMADCLLKMGVYVIGFSYPVVPQGKARPRREGAKDCRRESQEGTRSQDCQRKGRA